MYVRQNGEQKLTFVVSGMLWQRSLVMMDLETKSLWSHLLGRSMRGTLQDTELEPVTSLLTDWETWQRTHAKTTVMTLPRATDKFTRGYYRDLNKFVVGMADANQAKAWGFHDLSNHPLINDNFAGQPIVIHFDEKSATPFVYERKVGDQHLTFVRKDKRNIDEQTKSTWDLESGVATDGKLKDKKLKPVVATSSFRKAWQNFHPQSEYWKPARK